MSIDWENAPEGATHCIDEEFAKFIDGGDFKFHDGEWVAPTTPWSLEKYIKRNEEAGGMEWDIQERPQPEQTTSKSNGLTADYYELPANATQLQDLISFKDMNAQVGESFRSLYRYGQSSHSDKLRDAKKVVFYMNAEIERLEKYG